MVMERSSNALSLCDIPLTCLSSANELSLLKITRGKNVIIGKRKEKGEHVTSEGGGVEACLDTCALKLLDCWE